MVSARERVLRRSLVLRGVSERRNNVDEHRPRWRWRRCWRCPQPDGLCEGGLAAPSEPSSTPSPSSSAASHFRPRRVPGDPAQRRSSAQRSALEYSQHTLIIVCILARCTRAIMKAIFLILISSITECNEHIFAMQFLRATLILL